MLKGSPSQPGKVFASGSLCKQGQMISVRLKALLHYAFLACVLEENARDFALGNLQSFFCLT